MDNINENLMNAETAFANKQYEEALGWYRKVLEENPDDIYALSRAGAICVPLGNYKESLDYFRHAKELDPDNGDNIFNYANACFFNEDYQAAFTEYVEAEKVGCSEDVTPRLYYQLAMICSMRQDIKSSLTYFKKCEDADKQGLISLNPDLISEKLKLYMVESDYVNAEKCAAQLVAIQPTEFRNYMIYFSILMAHGEYAAAEKLLDDAEAYSEATDDEKVSLTLQKASLCVALAGKNPDSKDEFYKKAVDLIEAQRFSGNLTFEQDVEAVLTLSEIYMKSEDFDKAIDYSLKLLSGDFGIKKPEEKKPEAEIAELTEEEIDIMADSDIELIQEKIDSGEIDGDMGKYSETDYDEEGNQINRYEDSAFDALGNNEVPVQADEADEEIPEPKELSAETREKVYFNLLSCYMSKDEFDKAGKYAEVLKHSDNKYYNYFGIYSEAVACRKVKGKTAESDKKYAEALAFFRSKNFADPKDTLATVFRARLYAEDGKTAKAKELAVLLADEDRQSVLDYIQTFE